MEYRAVGNRCAVIIDALHLPISCGEALVLLNRKGFHAIDVDLIALARSRIGTSRYCRGAKPSEAPAIVDCSSFTKWLYGQRGIWLPRRSIQQRAWGDAVPLQEIVAGDLVFVAGWKDYYDDDPADGVGHVGIATGEGTVVHAADATMGVVETPCTQFLANNALRSVQRYIPKGVEVLTLATPAHQEVETTDDIRWIVLQSLR